MITNPALGGSAFASGNGVDYLAKLFPAIIELLFVVGFLAFVFSFLTGGIKWITAGGDKGKLEEAKQTLSNALIGIFLLFMFFAILSFVECFFGIGLRTIRVAEFSIGFDSIPVCNSSGATSTTSLPPVAGDPSGTTIPGLGSAACPCANGGCGVVGEVYQGPGTDHYICTSTKWEVSPLAISSTYCSDCN